VSKSDLFKRVITLIFFATKECRVCPIKKFVQPARQKAKQSPERAVTCPLQAFIEKNGGSIECVPDANGKSFILQGEWIR
jgi:hypothetical protein